MIDGREHECECEDKAESDPANVNQVLPICWLSWQRNERRGGEQDRRWTTLPTVSQADETIESASPDTGRLRESAAVVGLWQQSDYQVCGDTQAHIW
jgi:hypothetical protein